MAQPHRRGAGVRKLAQNLWGTAKAVPFVVFLEKGVVSRCKREDSLRRATFPSSWKSSQKSRKKPMVSSLPCALCIVQICDLLPHVHGECPFSFRYRIVSAPAPLPLMPTPNNDSTSTVAAHQRQRRKKKVDSSYAAISAVSCERVVKGFHPEQGIACADS